MAPVEVVSQAGGPFRLANPWDGAEVMVYRNGRKAEDLAGQVLSMATVKAETLLVAPKGQTVTAVKML